MRKMFFAAIAFILMAGYLFADVPNEVTYTGKLKEYGQPVTGTRSVNFRIYSTQTGTGQVWESGAHDVSVSSGTFSYVLMPGIDLRAKDFWIETVVSGKTMTPREKITSQFYALHANSAETLSVSAGKTMNFSIGTSTCASLSPAGEFKSYMNGTEYFMVPRGGIIMWSGTIASIPQGWAICDGTNSTPNLTDRFIVGAGNQYGVGISGGNPNHSHSINASSTRGLDDNNNETSVTSTPNLTSHADGNGGNGILASFEHTHAYIHHHNINTTSSSASNIPPYYALFFIKKL